MSGEKRYDLVVAGGGTAGTLCAIAAARSGMKTAVIERNAYLGGMAAGAGLTEMNAAGFQGKPLYKGIVDEIFREMIDSGHAQYHFAVPMSSNPDVKVDRLRYDPEILKIILEEKALGAGVEFYYETEVCAGSEASDRCRVTVRSRYETFELESDYLVDATGNADLVRMMGGETVREEQGKLLTATLMFRLSGIDIERLQAFLQSGKLSAVIQKGYQEGVLKGKILAFTPIPGSPDVSLNVTRADCDYEDARAYSQAAAYARSQILPVCRFIKENVPGTENCYISSISPFLGIRDARRIRGKYMLTIEDLEKMTDFEDSIAVGCYPMDIHDPVTKAVIWKMLPGVYHIPYRSVVPEKLHRTIVAGKCLSAEKKAFGAVRVMPIMMNVGESVGYAAALAKKEGKCLDELDAGILRKWLAEKYETVRQEDGHE